LAAWAQPWVAFVEEQAFSGAPRSPGLALPGALFDCTPFNVVRKPDGTLAAFDLEWQAAGGREIALAHVVFRGLYNGLLRVEFVAPPAPGVTAHIPTLCSMAMEALGLATA